MDDQVMQANSKRHVPRGDAHWRRRCEDSAARVRRKLSPELADAIRRRYAGGEVTQAQLAAEHGVSTRTVMLVLKNQIWAS